MHKEVEELIECERKRKYEKYKNLFTSKKNIAIIVLLCLIGIYTIYIQQMNYRFTKDLTYNAMWGRYESEYDGCELRVISTLSMSPRSEIYASVTTGSVYYPPIGSKLSICLWIYEDHFKQYKYVLRYEGQPKTNKGADGVIYTSSSFEQWLSVDANMNIQDVIAYIEKNEAEGRQVIIDNEETIKKLINAANVYWDLGLEYNPQR